MSIAFIVGIAVLYGAIILAFTFGYEIGFEQGFNEGSGKP